jgi:hypothetical protein
MEMAISEENISGHYKILRTLAFQGHPSRDVPETPPPPLALGSTPLQGLTEATSNFGLAKALD